MRKDVVVDGVVIGSFCLPDGYDVVAYRQPLQGERYLDSACVSVNIAPTDCCVGSRFIVRKLFVWPGWVKPGTWYARDEDGAESLSNHKPTRHSSCWSFPYGSSVAIYRLVMDFPEVPPCDWKDSLMQKPLEAK